MSTGRYAASTLFHLLTSGEWSGQQLDPDLANEYVAVEGLTLRMANSTGWGAPEVEQAITFLGSEIARLGTGK